MKYKAGTSNLLQRNENPAGAGFDVPASFLPWQLNDRLNGILRYDLRRGTSEITPLKRGRNAIQGNRQDSVTAKRCHLTSQKFTLTAFCRLSVLVLTVTAELPSLSRLKPTMTAVLPSPVRGITGNAAFVQAIHENGITHDAIAQTWGGPNVTARKCSQHTPSERSRPRPLPMPQEQQNYPCPQG